MKKMEMDRRNQGATAPSAPTSPLTGVANFPGSPNSLGNPRAMSTGGSGFGFQPDLSGASPGQLSNWMNTLSHLVYSVPAGGYISETDAQNANSWYNKFGQGSGGNPASNRAAHDVYAEIGGFPTQAIGTPALAKLQASHPGLKGASGPSFNERLGSLAGNPFAKDAGFGPTWEGPWDIPGY
jgi:hypothetical protein